MPELTNVRERAAKSEVTVSDWEEYVALQNSHIQAAAALEAEQRAAQDAMNQEILSRVNPDASCTVVIVANGEVGDGQDFGSLDAIEIYGNKGMSRYVVAEGDSLVQIVFVNSTPFTPQAPTAAEKKESEKK